MFKNKFSKFNFINKALGRFSLGLGVDLGTVNSLVYVSGKGIVIDEPSVVAVNEKTGNILAIGKEACQMVGKTPPHIKAEKPLIEGVISNFEVAEMMLSYFLDKVQQSYFGLRPQVVAAIPQGATEVDQGSVRDALTGAGARKVWLVKEPVAAAVGARLPIKKALGNMIVDIGGGTTEVAVISLGGIVVKKDLLVAGDTFCEDIKKYVRSHLNLIIGDQTAEKIKISCGTALNPKQRLEDEIRGRDLLKGLPRRKRVDGNQIFRAINESVTSIIRAIQATIEEVPPELIDDIINRGMVLTGGGALLRGFKERIEQEVEIPVVVAQDPLTDVVRGTGMILEDIDEYREILE